VVLAQHRIELGGVLDQPVLLVYPDRGQLCGQLTGWLL
jgi:hypothetical protein